MMKSWSEIREVSWGVLAIFLVAIIAAAAFVNLVFFRLAVPQVVVDATAALVGWTLMGSAIILVVVYYLFLYLRTSNLFFAVGVHALTNQPLTLVQSDLATPLIMLLALAAAFFWRTSAPPAGRSASDAV